MKEISRLLDIMTQLRDPKAGCPWDLEQDFKSLIPFTLEEAYEVAEAAEEGDPDDLREELGDLLLQVVFHGQIGKEAGLFDFESIAKGISDKLIRRHPHVFEGIQFETPEERQLFWEESKIAERQEKGKAGRESLLGVIPQELPALMRAQKLQKRAARHGFDWPDLGPVFEKLHEEIDELKEAITRGDQTHIQEELGDVLFVMANIARHLEIDAEASLRGGNHKFTRRFHHIESRVKEQGLHMSDLPLEALDAFWDEAKALEKGTLKKP
jgi:MazG family protein